MHYIHTCINACIHTHAHRMHRYARTHRRTYTRTYIHACVHTYIRMHIHTLHKHTYTHKHIHTRTIINALHTNMHDTHTYIHDIHTLHTCAQACMHAYMCVCVCVCVRETVFNAQQRFVHVPMTKLHSCVLCSTDFSTHYSRDLLDGEAQGQSSVCPHCV